jgi:hypothetical protein
VRELIWPLCAAHQITGIDVHLTVLKSDTLKSARSSKRRVCLDPEEVRFENCQLNCVAAPTPAAIIKKFVLFL